jgi:hypothetical protein
MGSASNTTAATWSGNDGRLLRMNLAQIADLVQALAWPVIVLLIAFAFRRQLTASLGFLGGRVSKISVAGVGFEFAGVQGISTGAELFSAIRDPVQAGAFSAHAVAAISQTSGMGTLKDLIRSGERTDYAIIDLGEGERWLTSRLYIFAAMLRWALAVNEFAFVETAGGIRRRFVGKAPTSSICLILGDRFQWLPQAFSWATGATPLGTYSVFPGQTGPRQLPGEPGQSQAIQLIETYLTQLQLPAPPVGDEREWVALGPATAVSTYEHARWLTPSFVESLLGQELDSESITVTLKTSGNDLAKQAIAAHGQYVACVDEDRRLKNLLDRYKVAEAVARQSVQ